MCTRIQCERCGRPAWVGCGRHVELVLGDVPPAQRCQCDRPLRTPWWKRLLRRRRDAGTKQV